MRLLTFKILLGNLEGPQAFCTSHQLMTNLGVHTAILGLIICYNESQNSGRYILRITVLDDKNQDKLNEDIHRARSLKVHSFQPPSIGGHGNPSVAV